MSQGPASSQTDLDETRLEPSIPPTGGSLTNGRMVSGSHLRRGAMVGRYLVVDQLGAGGMGEVFSAYDPELDRRVALKLVKFGANEDATKARGRLLREAQALAKLSHPNVVAVYDAGTHGDRVFIAMEHVEGRTLRNWMHDAARREPAQTWPEALSLMIQAGRGLAAAHQQGLVHRDFKPANVMVSEDGRVRVLDFGLARRFDDDQEDSERSAGELLLDSMDSLSGSRGSLQMQLTQTGMVMGTPAYMAPEQFFGGGIDARTDQFAFCVVLFRALFGIRPFAGESFSDLGRAVGKGQLREMPKSARVPRAIQQALRRGLSVSRSDRYPTMDALLGDLQRGRGHARRRLLMYGGGAAVVAGLGGAALLGSSAAQAPTPCQGAETKLEGIWDDDRRQAISTAFAATELAYAEDARTGIESALDDYTDHWIRLRTETCEATRVRGDQSEALMDLRIGCLDAGLRDVSALTALLAEDVDADVVKNAVLGVRQLPSLEDCTSLDRDTSDLLVPEDAEVAAEVDGVREEIAKSRARALSGKYDDALSHAQRALELAEQTDYLPVLAEVQVLLGQIQDKRAAPDPTREHFLEALYAASESGHIKVEAQALMGLSSVFGLHLADPASALRYALHAEAVTRRLGSPPDMMAAIMLYRGNATMTDNKLDTAIEHFRASVSLSRGIPEAERTHLAALNNVAAVLGQQGKYHEASEAFLEALEAAETMLGPWHPVVGSTTNNLGVTYSRLEEYDKAMTYQRRAIDIYTKVLGEAHPELGRGYHNLGVVQSAMGDDESAYLSYRKALEIKTKALGPEHISVAFSSNNVADALVRLGRPAEALPYAEDALRVWTDLQGRDASNNVFALVSLAQAHLALGHPEEAEPLALRALELGDAKELDPVELAKASFVAAKALAEVGGDMDKAKALARRARAGYQASQRPSSVEIAEIDAWLAEIE